MIRVNASEMEIQGDGILVSTEVSMLLRVIRQKDRTLIPAILSCVYTDGGSSDLNKALEEFKEDTTEALKNIERIEVNKSGREH